MIAFELQLLPSGQVLARGTVKALPVPGEMLPDGLARQCKRQDLVVAAVEFVTAAAAALISVRAAQ